MRRRLPFLPLILLLLGFLVPTPARAVDTADGTPRWFSETGHTLGYSFKVFWEQHGGLPIFGYPISEVFIEDGRPIQYFERARFEWHPELPPEDQVQLGQLGRQYLETVHPAQEWALAPTNASVGAWDGIRPTHIRIPRVNLDTDIVEGGFSLSGWEVPRYTAVHYWPVAGIPGTRGNIVLAGHVGYRDTIFNQLPEVVVGDEIVLSIGPNERRYHVTTIWTVLPTDTWTMAPTPDETLTLITCIPINVYNYRLIVRAVPVAA